MSIMTVNQFLSIADRMAAQYSDLVQTFTTVNGGSTQATLLIGDQDQATATIQSDTHASLLIQTVQKGTAGNDFKLIIDLHTTNFAVPTAYGYFGSELIIYPSSDMGGNPITPLSEIFTWISSHPYVQTKLNLLGVSFDPSAILNEQPFLLLLGATQNTLSLNQLTELGKTKITSISPFYGGASENALLLTAVNPGYAGNLTSLTLIAPSSPAQTLSITVTGQDITVNLATDGDGNVSTTAAQLVNALNANTDVSALITAELPSGGTGTAVVSALDKTYLSGGLTGIYEDVVLQCTGGFANPDLATSAVAAAINLDSALTITTLANNGVGWTNMITALNAHFSAAGQAGLTQGFLTDNNLRVHRDFATLYLTATGSALNAVNVFRPDIVTVGHMNVLSGVPTLSGTVNLGTGANLVSTTNYAPQELSATLTPATHVGHVTMLAGNSGIIYTSRIASAEANNLQVEYLLPALNPSPLVVKYIPFDPTKGKRKISVILSTDSGGTVLTTASALKTALDANPECAAVATTALVGNGTGLLSAVAATSMSGGLGLDLAADLNFKVTLTLDSNNTALVVDQIRFPQGSWLGASQVIAQRAKVTLASKLRFVAKEAGTAGNSIKVTIVNPGTANQDLIITVTGTNINISLETDGSAAITSTPTTIAQAIGYDTAASALVWVDVIDGSATPMGAVSQTSLAGGAAPPKALGISAVGVDPLGFGAGTEGDLVTFTQIVERTVSL